MSSLNNERFALAHEHVFFKNLFSDNNLKFISNYILKKTGKIVEKKQIINILDSYYTNGSGRDIEEITAMTMRHIVDTINNEIENGAKNKKLNIWVTKYLTSVNDFDDKETYFGTVRLAEYDKIKVREKSKNNGMFIETY